MTALATATRKPLTPRERLALERFALDVLAYMETPEGPDWAALDEIAASAEFHGLTRAGQLFRMRRVYRGRTST